MGYDSFGGKNTGHTQFAVLEFLSPVLGEDIIPVTTPPSETNFLRYALKKGLQQQAELGVNSFKFGMISSTDTHIAAPGLTMEKNHPGHGGAGMGARDGMPAGLPDELEYGPGGLAVLYAEENSRDALFAAMQRREAYATSGTRPVLRFFGGWNYPENLCEMDDMVAQGYAGGVPMGGDLPSTAAADASPRFLVSASMDTGTPEYPGSPLQRIQLVKGWHEDGELHEKVLGVAGGDNDASVDINTCEPAGSGHSQLCSVWQDNDFNRLRTGFLLHPRVGKPQLPLESAHLCQCRRALRRSRRAFLKEWKTAVRQNTRKLFRSAHGARPSGTRRQYDRAEETHY